MKRCIFGGLNLQQIKRMFNTTNIICCSLSFHTLFEIKIFQVHKKKKVLVTTKSLKQIGYKCQNRQILIL